jgi:UDP-N-acetylmuramate dehydrogenase
MMAARKEGPSLLDRLPPVRGRLSAGVLLAPITWFRVGGAAEVMFRPADVEDLATFLKAKPADVAVHVIGVGSNLLVRDGGVPGVVIRLGRAFAQVVVDSERVSAGAGALDATVALTARDHSLAGLEFLSGIPGTIGGALRMNAGAYGREMVHVLIAAEAVDTMGHRHRLLPADIGFAYRHTSLPADWIVTSAQLRGEPGELSRIALRMEDIRRAREDTQPVRARTGGSTFANPPGARAWELIDRAGCRGLTIGGAQVSEKHCNFLINTGNATAQDLEALGEEIRRRVLDSTGILLRWEIQRIGVPLAGRTVKELNR